MPLFTDGLGRSLEIATPPQRIVSLVPSQTELLYHLGLDSEVAGITKFCVHPQHWFRTKTRIGGTKQLHIEKIKSLQPQLIIANREENTQQQVEELAKIFPVWVSHIITLTDALGMISSIGKIVQKQTEAENIINRINQSFARLQSAITGKKIKAAYLIWKDPYMTVGGDTFIHHLMQEAGFDNVFATEKRYPQITIPDMKSKSCEVLLLSTEPYPFTQKHIDALKKNLPQLKMILADGEMFSWYGSRLLYAPAYFRKLQQQVALIV